MPQPSKIEDALLTILRACPGGVDAAKLREQLMDLGYSRSEVQAALSEVLNRGRVRLGPNLRFALEFA